MGGSYTRLPYEASIVCLYLCGDAHVYILHLLLEYAWSKRAMQRQPSCHGPNKSIFPKQCSTVVGRCMRSHTAPSDRPCVSECQGARPCPCMRTLALMTLVGQSYPALLASHFHVNTSPLSLCQAITGEDLSRWTDGCESMLGADWGGDQVFVTLRMIQTLDAVT